MSDGNDSKWHHEPSGAPQPEVKVSKPNVALIAAAVVIAACVIVFLRNSHKVSLDFLFFAKTTTVRWSILMSIVLGVLLDRAFTIWWRRRRRKKNAAEHE